MLAFINWAPIRNEGRLEAGGGGGGVDGMGVIYKYRLPLENGGKSFNELHIRHIAVRLV